MDHDFEQDHEQGSGSRKPRKGIYILPNLFTLAALFGGFYAIVMAMNERFDMAAVGVFCAMVLDSLDGRVARMTNTQSAFGEQMDSLADMVSFGAAPALIAYEWALKGLVRWGWIAAFVYCACAALRLARFNVNTAVVDKRYFQGLPSPAAAALIAGLVWIVTDLRETKWITASPQDLAWAAWLLTVYAGVTMVSNAPFYSGKEINLKKSVSFIFLLALVLMFVVVSSDPPVVLFSLFLLYGLSGYAVWFLRWRSGRELPWKEAAAAQARSDHDERQSN